MLVAVNRSWERVEASAASKEEEACLCPACGSILVLKRGALKVPHFAHQPRANCWLASEGESQRHLQMKLQMKAMLPSAELEVICNPGHRADLLVGKFVIECQASPISILEWRKRIEDYNAMDYAVLWVWDLARVVGKKNENKSSKELTEWDENPEIVEYRIPAEIRECHRCSFGKVYVLNPEGKLAALHLGRVIKYNDWEDGPAEIRLKATKSLSFHSVGKVLQELVNSKEKLTLASLGEQKWWSNERR